MELTSSHLANEVPEVKKRKIDSTEPAQALTKPQNSDKYECDSMCLLVRCVLPLFLLLLHLLVLVLRSLDLRRRLSIALCSTLAFVSS